MWIERLSCAISLLDYTAAKDEILIQLDPRKYEVALQKAKGKVLQLATYFRAFHLQVFCH